MTFDSLIKRLTFHSEDTIRHKLVSLHNLFMPSGFFCFNSLDWSISNRKGVWLMSIITMFFIEIPIINANSVDPDQTPRSPTSQLSIHCLPMSL